MSYCKQCKIQVNDPVNVCPLCHCAINKEGTEEWKYPQISQRRKKRQLALRIYFAAAVLAQVLCFYLNTQILPQMQWSLWSLATFVMGYVALRMSLSKRTGYRGMTIGLTIFATAYIVFVDYELGFAGWSLNYVVPTSIILLNIAVIVMIFVNRRNWQSYLIVEMFLILCSILPMVFIWLKITTETWMALTALWFSIGLFFCTLVVGGRKAKMELKRRFHI